MAVHDIKIGLAGSEITLPVIGRGALKFSSEKIGTFRRTYSGRGVEDRIATKLTIEIPFDEVTNATLDTLLDLYDLNEVLSLLVYTGVATYDSYSVLMQPLDRERISYLGDGVWSGVSLKLEQE